MATTTVKDSAFAIAAAVAAAEAAHPNSRTIEALHKTLRSALYRHRDDLGLSADDVAAIDNHGPQQRGGGPKPPEGDA